MSLQINSTWSAPFFKSIAAPIIAVGAICGVIAATAPDANAEAGGRIVCEVRETDRNGRQRTTAESGRLDFYPGSDMQLQVGRRESINLTLVNGFQGYDQCRNLWAVTSSSGGFAFATSGLNFVCVVAE